MERKTDEQVLAEAEELLKHNQESMAQQRRVILGLERAGGDVTHALEDLAKLLKVQNEHERRLKYLRTWCGK
jgi:signal transduction histidine kinase